MTGRWCADEGAARPSYFLLGCALSFTRSLSRFARGAGVLVSATALLGGIATTAQAASAGDPQGNFEKAAAVAGGIELKAWGIDPDTTEALTMRVSVNGKVREVRADTARADLAQAFPAHGGEHALATTIEAAPGMNRVCLSVLNVAAGSDQDLGCRVVRVPAAPAAQAAPQAPAAPVAPAAPAAPVAPVAPAAPVSPELQARQQVQETTSRSGARAGAGIRPDATNTGVPAGTVLTRHNGDLVITRAGTVIDGLDVHGTISVRADNVVIKNTRVRGKASTHNVPLISMNKGFRNLVVMDTEIAPANPSPYQYGIMGWNFTLERVNIHHVIDSAHIYGPNVTIRHSFLHSNMHYVNDPNWGGKPSHDDGIQIQQGSNIRIIGNRIEDAYNATIMITQDQGRSSDIHLIGNWIDGASCNLNLAEKGRGPITGVVAKDNTFGRNTRIRDCAMLAPSTSKIDASNNRYTDGATATVRAGR